MNLIIVLLFAAAMLTVGILIGIIVNQKGTKEYRGEIINTLCDEVQELQALKMPEMDWDQFREMIDTRIEALKVKEMVKEMVENEMNIYHDIQVAKKVESVVLTIDGVPTYIEDELFPLIQQESLFRGYANDNDKINTITPTVTKDGKYYLKAGAWAMYTDNNGYIQCHCEGNFQRHPEVFYNTSQEVLKVYQFIKNQAIKEKRWKQSEVA
jgi:hypothetical protein